MYEYKYTVMQPKVAKTLNHQLWITPVILFIVTRSANQNATIVYD